MRHRVWLLFLLLLQGCAGTPLAEQLERSFATPDDPAPAESPATAPVQSQQTTPAKVALNTGAGKNEPVTKPEPVSRVEAAAEAGITAVIQPGGSMRDEEVIAAADEHGIAMVFTGMRHFRH